MDAVDQSFRLVTQGTETAFRVTGVVTKHTLALLCVIAAGVGKGAVWGAKKLRRNGAAREMKKMIEEGHNIEVIRIREADMKKFVEGAKNYGIKYSTIQCPELKEQGLVDINIRGVDAPRIEKMIEAKGIGAVGRGKIEKKPTLAKSKDSQANRAPKDIPTKTMTQEEVDSLVKEILIDADKAREGKTVEQPATPQQQPMPQNSPNPTVAKTANSRPSEPSSKRNSKTARGASSVDKPSVKKELRDIKTEQGKQEAAMPEPKGKQSQRSGGQKPNMVKPRRALKKGR